MKIAVCDDNSIIRSKIAEMVCLVQPDCTIYEFESGRALIDYKARFDIIFLDIKMPEISGIETAQALRRRQDNAEIIFVTGVKEYVFEAFDVGAFHYLVKPLDKVKFLTVFTRAVNKKEQDRLTENLLRQNQQSTGRIIVKNGATSRRIVVGDIYAAEVRNRKVILYTREGDFEYYAKLSELKEQLGEDFFRCHRSFLAALDYVVSYDCDTIRMENGMEIMMAKQKYQDFVKAYMKYLKRNNQNERYDI